LEGIYYPSVRTEYKGKNIALTPFAVEKYLKLEKVAVFKYTVKNGQPMAKQTHYSDSFGNFNSQFNWKEY